MTPLGEWRFKRKDWDDAWADWLVRRAPSEQQQAELMVWAFRVEMSGPRPITERRSFRYGPSGGVYYSDHVDEADTEAVYFRTEDPGPIYVRRFI